MLTTVIFGRRSVEQELPHPDRYRGCDPWREYAVPSLLATVHMAVTKDCTKRLRISPFVKLPLTTPPPMLHFALSEKEHLDPFRRSGVDLIARMGPVHASQYR